MRKFWKPPDYGSVIKGDQIKGIKISKRNNHWKEERNRIDLNCEKERRKNNSTTLDYLGGIVRLWIPLWSLLRGLYDCLRILVAKNFRSSLFALALGYI